MDVLTGSYIWEKTIIFAYIPTEGHMFLGRNHHYLHKMLGFGFIIVVFPIVIDLIIKAKRCFDFIYFKFSF